MWCDVLVGIVVSSSLKLHQELESNSGGKTRENI
jgi:hypothetical protein